MSKLPVKAHVTTLTGIRTAAALCAALLTLSACGGAASEAAKPAAPKADAPAAAAPTLDTSTSVKVAETADEIPLTSNESIHTPRFEIPGVPVYPNAVSLAMKGIGPVMKLGNASTAFYAVTASALDVATYYREKLQADGWKDELDGLQTDITHETRLLVLAFRKDKNVIRITYHDGTTEKEITGPRLSIMSVKE